MCRKDREQWWIAKAQEIEKEAEIENSRVPLQLIRNTGPSTHKVNEVICGKDETLIYFQQCHRHQLSQYFQEQLSWPESVIPFCNDNPGPQWDLNISSPTEAEITRDCL